jgi:hypothetical protein
VRPARFRLPALASALLLALVLAGCGNHSNPPNADANNDGTYIKAGDVTYQLQVSRALNQYLTEDHQYLSGLPAGTTTPAPDQLWYGVFLWAKNNTNQPRQTASNFAIVDTSGNHYYPVQLNSSLNPYAWTPQTLAPLQIEPAPNTTASFGPTQGSLLLFKLNTSVYANRPLTLEIHPPGSSEVSTISLDL